MIYNGFGCEWTDIIALFSGEESDFAAGCQSGQTVIENEIEMQTGKLLQNIPGGVVAMMDTVAGLYRETVPVTDGSMFEYPAELPPLPGTTYGYIRQTDVDDRRKVGPKCGCPYDSLTEIVIEDAYDEENEIWYGVAEEDLGSYDLYIRYDIDTQNSKFIIPELRNIVRDLVACVMGGKLMLENEDKWRLLDTVCSTKATVSARFIPYLWKTLTWYQKPWQTGMITGKFYRG